uniref:Uncharacterized protein n=1 Tax=Meloidogyne enterolobii TaxID=390850 RepID=A0A6V7TVU7_MELEN|nr:unnamed protein product [Meloidogyne enterolobii]
MRNCNNYMSNTNLNQNRGNNMAIKNQNNCAINSRKNYSQQNRSNGQLKDFGNSCKVLNKRIEDECGNLLFLNQGKSRGIRVEDILWWICFIFTVYYFDLPATLIFSRKINRFFLQIMALCVLLIVFLTFIFTLLKNFKILTRHWILFSIQFLTIFFFISTPLSFCLSTWDEFNVWSIYIAYVGTQSTLALIAVL